MGQSGQPIVPDAFGMKHSNLPHPGDGRAMGTYAECYKYDAVGNILHMEHCDPNSNGWKREYNYPDTSNRLGSTKVGGTTENYAHDANGNMTEMPHLRMMQWDHLDQLAATSRSVDGTQPVTYYVYDSAGQRVRKVTETAGRRKDERIYLDGFEVYRKYDASGTTETLRRETLHVMDDKQRIAMVERRTNGTEGDARLIRFQLNNHLGSACIELDQEAKLISYEEYFPFGATSYQSRSNLGTNPKRYRYTGKERDEENGFYYHGARYYASWLGRWTACDPKTPPESFQLYEYCRNNPVNRLDHSGGESNWCWTCNPFSSDVSLHPLPFLNQEVAPRAVGAVQLAGATVEAFAAGALIAAPEPTTLTKVAGWGLAIDASDNASSALYKIVTGRDRPTLKATISESAAETAGASPATAQSIGSYVDFTVGLATAVVTAKVSMQMPRTSAGIVTQTEKQVATTTPIAERNVIIVTPRGVAVPSELLARQGTSQLAGDFRGLAGKTVEEIFERVPSGWKLVPQDKGAGVKFLDELGIERIRMHGPSATAPSGSNAASGWTLRVMDRAGNYYDDLGNVVKYKSNEGHIPIYGNRNAP